MKQKPQLLTHWHGILPPSKPFTNMPFQHLASEDMLDKVKAKSREHFPDCDTEEALYKYVTQFGVAGIFVLNQNGDRYLYGEGMFISNEKD